jgi:hypothetical protein
MHLRDLLRPEDQVFVAAGSVRQQSKLNSSRKKPAPASLRSIGHDRRLHHPGYPTGQR